METHEAEVIKEKIVTGVFALTSRTFILQIIAFVATFILTIILTPSIFGVYFVANAVISFLSYFSDVGLAAALIQKKEEPSREELVSTFTIQQILVISVVVIALLLSGAFASFYKLDSGGIFLLQALLISFFLSSLKTIPSVLIERKLEFKLLVIPQILETFTFYLIAIILAVKDAGVASFAWAAIGRGIIGLIAIYMISPWRIGVGISIKTSKHLLSFGIPFQANSILALIKDDLLTIFLGKILPFSAVGFIGWAKKWAETPLRLIMDSVIRVTFPAYSRLQEDRQLLSKTIEKSLFFLALFIFPTTVLLMLFMKPLIYQIPRYTKWEPALFSFYLFAASSIFAAFSSPLVNALNALGKIKITLILMVIWTALTWILVPILSSIFGFNGVALSALFIGSTSFLPIMLVRRIVYFKIIASVFKPLVTTLCMAIFVLIFIPFAHDFFTLLIVGILAVVFYGVVTWLWMKEEILPYISRLLK